MKRSTGVDGYGIPLGITGATADRHDSPLLRDTFAACSAQLRHHLFTKDAQIVAVFRSAR